MALFRPKTVPCPHCYRAIDLSRVVFRCTGQAQAGRTGCVPSPDANRQQFLGDGSPVRPIICSGGVELRGKTSVRCPDCGAQSSVRCCEHCHSVLPSSIQKDSPLIGLVGVRNSGKTVMLSALHTELTQTVARRFRAAIDNPTGSAGLASVLHKNVEEMSRPGGTLPEQTHRGQKSAPAVYEWRYELKNRMRSILFSFYDNAGEDFASEDSATELAYLGQVSGLILLLDPFSFPENAHLVEEKGIELTHSDTPEQVLASLTEVLRKAHNTKTTKKISVPVAVVVSKIDAFFDALGEGHPLRKPSSKLAAFDEAESADLDEHMKGLVRDWGGDGLLRSLDANFDTFRVFGASALGAEPDYSKGTTSERGRLPHRVAEPFLWLLAERGFLPKQKD
jgi:hypothetical protein